MRTVIGAADRHAQASPDTGHGAAQEAHHQAGALSTGTDSS